MKKLIIGLLITMFSACGSKLAPTASVDTMATIVEATLAAVPTDTPIMLLPTETSAPVSTATETSEPTPTETQTITPTIVTDDIRNTLGNPVWQDSLDNCSSFGLCTPYEDDYSRVSVSSGSMIMTSKTSGGFRIWRLTYPRPKNMYLEGTFKTQNCSGADLYGLVFRAKDYTSGEGYYLGFTCDGRVGLSRWDAGGVSSVFSLTTSDAIHAGANQTNRIGVLVNGDTFRVYANGKFIQEINDTSIGAEGHVGAYISAQSTLGFTVELTEIAYWNLP